MENENNNSNLNNSNNIPQQFNNSNGYSDANFQNNDPYASQINSNLSSFNDNTISYNNELPQSNIDNSQYSSMPGMNQNNQYNSMPGMDQNDQYNAMPGMNQNDQYNAMPGMNQTDQYNAMPGMDQNDQYSAMPGMDQNDQYSAMPGMDQNNQYSATPNMDSNDQYNTMPSMDSNDSLQNNNYDQFNNMDSNTQLNGNNDSYLINQYNNEYDANYNQNQNYNNMNYNQNNFDPNMNMNYNSNDYIEPMDVPGYDQNQGQLNPQYYDSNNMSEQNGNNDQQSFNQTENIDEEFMKNWMGNFYSKSNNKFNVCAFLFGPIYFLYRKVTSFGAIFLAIHTILLSIMFFLTMTSPLTSMALIGTISLILLILYITYGFIFNGLYKGFIKSKQKSLSTTMDSNQLLDYAKQKGDTSVLGTILGIAILIIFVMISNIAGISMKANSLKKKTTTIKAENTVQTPVVTPEKKLSEYTFTAGSANTTYILSYNSSVWTFNKATNSLTLPNGDVFKYADNYIEKLSTQINTSVSTEQGRSTFFNMYTNAFAQSATQSNGTSTPSPQGFVQKGTNIYYAYNDIVVNNTVTRYYLLLIPSIDMNFQFTLTSQLSSIDATENTEVEKMFETFTTPTNSSILTQTEGTNDSANTQSMTGTTNGSATGTTTGSTTGTTPEPISNTHTTTPGTSSSASTSSAGTTNSGTGTTQNQIGVDYNTTGTSSPSNAITSTTTDLNSVI